MSSIPRILSMHLMTPLFRGLCGMWKPVTFADSIFSRRCTLCFVFYILIRSLPPVTCRSAETYDCDHNYNHDYHKTSRSMSAKVLCACCNDTTRFCGRCRMQKCVLFNKQQLEEKVYFYDVWCLPRMRLWVTTTLSDDNISNCLLLRTIPTAKCCLISIVLVATTRNTFYFYILIRSLSHGTYS